MAALAEIAATRRLRRLSRRRPSRAVRRANSLRPPTGAAIAMNKLIRDRLELLNKEIEEEIFSVLDALLPPAQREERVITTDPSERTDALPEFMVRKLELIELRLGVIFDEEALGEDLDIIAKQVSTKNRVELRRLVGVDVRADPGVGALIDEFIEQNVRRIRGVAGQQLLEVTEVMNDAQRGGLRIETVAKQMQERFGVSRSRAALIARDQTLTLNARIARTRMTNLGIEEFIWTTSGDARVRDEHDELDGKQFTFAAGAPGEGVPGEPVGCRCTAFPVLPELA